MSSRRFEDTRSPSPLPPDEDDNPDHEEYLERCFLTSKYFKYLQSIGENVPYFRVVPSYNDIDIDLNKPKANERKFPLPIDREYNKKLTTAIVQRLHAIEPNEQDMKDLRELSKEIERVLMLLCNDNRYNLNSFMPVGSFVFNTQLGTLPLVVDFALIFNHLPELALLRDIGVHVRDYSKFNLEDTYGDYYCELTLRKNENNTSQCYSVRLLFTTKMLLCKEKHSSICIKKNLLGMVNDACKHVNWFYDLQENNPEVAQSLSQLVLLIKDLGTRIEELKKMGPWVMIALAHYALTHGVPGGIPRTLSQAFLIFFRLLASGFLMSYTQTLPDPVCPVIPIQGSLSNENMNKIMESAGVMLRKLHSPSWVRFVLPEGKNVFEIDQIVADTLKAMEKEMTEKHEKVKKIFAETSAAKKIKGESSEEKIVTKKEANQPGPSQS